MQKFTCQYRERGGALKTKVFEAADRAALFTQLKARGIEPIRVAAGVDRQGEGGRFQIVRIAILAVAVLAAISIVVFLIPSKDNIKKPHVNATVRQKKPERRKGAFDATNHVATSATHHQSPDASRPPQMYAASIFGIQTNNLDNVTNSEKRVVHKRIFRTPTESILWHIFSTPLGKAPPLLPQIPTKDLRNIHDIIENSFYITDADTAKDKDMKMTVTQAKEALKRFLADGGDTREFIIYYRHELDKAHKEWIDAQRLLTEVARQGDEQMTKEFFAKANEQLGKKGIIPLKMPERLINKGVSK